MYGTYFRWCFIIYSTRKCSSSVCYMDALFYFISFHLVLHYNPHYTKTTTTLMKFLVVPSLGIWHINNKDFKDFPSSYMFGVEMVFFSIHFLYVWYASIRQWYMHKMHFIHCYLECHRATLLCSCVSSGTKHRKIFNEIF